MKLSLIIVNYNTETYIGQLLDDLTRQSLPTDVWQVILVNNSQNDKLKLIIQTFDDLLNLKMIQLPENVGFGRAMNVGAEAADGDYLLLMNPDIRMLQDNYLENLLKAATLNKSFGVISTCVLDGLQRDVSTKYQYEFDKDLGFSDQICWFQGSLMLICADVYRKAGGFDPDFFMYCEDVDLCYRIKKLGYPLIKQDKLKVFHIGGVSEPARDLNFYLKYYKSRWLFAHKHLDRAEFELLLQEQNKKAQIRVIFYGVLKLFSRRYNENYHKNLATTKIIRRVKNESTDWLYHT